MTTVHKFGGAPLTCHAWSGDRKQIAVSHNNKDVVLYKTGAGGKGWDKTSVLDQHDLRVTGIDWAPKTNRIVTCSSDRNAYVWVKDEEGVWRHKLVVLRINRAATCVRWSPEENKFAAGSGAKMICVCYYDEEYDWWAAKHIKKPLKSTVTTVDWHPNNVLLAAGSADFKMRVFSGYIKEIEGKPSATPWGAKMTFGNLMAEYANSLNGGGWVHAVSFSSDGSKVAWVGHDASVNVVEAGNGDKVFRLLTSHLPFLSIVWVSPSSFLAAGHNYVPMVFHVAGDGTIKEGGRLEEEKKAELGPMSNARRMFQNMDVLGQTEAGGTKITTTHENQVNEVRVVSSETGGVRLVSTCGGDGKLVLWNITDIASKMKNLRI